MCDERTGSRITALSTAKRNGLSGQHIVEMAQLQEFWTYGFDTPEYTHSAHLKLPEHEMAPIVQLPTPSLQDLLNPVVDEEEPQFNNPDPYDFAKLGDEDDEDGPEPTPFVQRGASRLAIDDFIDLNNVKLQARYDGKPATPSAKVADAPMAPASPWVEAEYSADSFEI
jgi:hypothetical protein